MNNRKPKSNIGMPMIAPTKLAEKNNPRKPSKIPAIRMSALKSSTESHHSNVLPMFGIGPVFPKFREVGNAWRKRPKQHVGVSMVNGSTKVVRG
jgi:hypothetical protein